MTNLFPQDHLFTRLLAEAEAAEAARLVEAEQRAQEDEQRRQTDMVLRMAEFAAHIGQEFVEALMPYITQTDYSRQSGRLTLRLDIPQHDRIHVYYSTQGASVKTYGIGENHFRPDYMQPFAETLTRARKQYEQEAAARAHQEAIAAAQAEYEAETARVREANRAALAALQAEYDTPFHLWVLEYQFFVDDGDVPDFGTETVMTPHDEPDERGMWLVIGHNGLAEKRRFFYPTSLSGPNEYRPSTGHYARHVQVDRCTTVGYVPPMTDAARVAEYARRAAAVLLPLPAMPDILTGLDI